MHHRPQLPLLACGAAFLVADGAAAAAKPEPTESLPVVARLVAEASRAPAAESFAAMRALWREWDQGDPAEVEEGLRAVAAARSGSTKVYAELLGAYARRRRGDLDGARAVIARLGFLRAWSIVGPFDNEGKAGLSQGFGPETDASPISAATSYPGKERKVAWRTSPAASPFGWIDGGALVRPSEKVCFFATVAVRDPSIRAGQRKPASIWAGSSGALRVTWNGTVAIEDTKYRSLDAERWGASVVLEAGYNRVLVKACGDESAPVFTLRVGTASGEPYPGLEASTSPEDLSASQRASAKPLPAQSAVGPVTAFERAIKAGDPAALEAYARYLVSTASDDDADHLARDLSTRAAEKAPTPRRALLAASLAESRNQQAWWLAKADALTSADPASAEDRKATLLARAAHARAGVNPREAAAFYDAVLAADPDDVSATLARADMLADAGLRATSLAIVERALARHPRSVALVRAAVNAMRDEDRTAEAEALEERYAALRFDDASFARGKIDLAVARRDKAAAARWGDRLLALDPDAESSLETAARTWALLGDRAHAVALYKRALELAPEDTDSLRALADLHALGGQQADQQALLRRILELAPQSKDVRDYLSHLEPDKPREDEAWAVAPKEFLARRAAPAAGADSRRLVDLQVVKVFENGLSSKFTQVVFQPLTEAAAQSARVYGFAFEGDTQSVQLRAVHVYRQDGTVDDSFDTGVSGADDPSIATYTSASTFRVRFARLSPGDVVELQYRVEDVSERNAFADYFGDVAYLESSEPVGFSRYVLIAPKSRPMVFNKPNVPGLVATTEEKADTRVSVFTAKDLPAVLPEPNQPPYAEFLGHVHVSTYRSWDDMGRWYWGLVKDQFVADDEVRRRAAEVAKGKKTDREKVAAVYDYVVQKTRYVALEFGIHGYKPYKCAQIFARGFGDCKDKATLIVSMLRELGIPATIVIVRTGMRGDFEDSPASLAPFDHAIAYVPSLDLYLDGTAEYTGSGELPAMDRGALALQVNEGHPRLVHLPDPPASESVTSRRVTVDLASDGSAALRYDLRTTGVSASAWRQRYHAESSRKQRMQEDLAGEVPGVEVQSVTSGDFEDIEAPPSLQVTAKARTLGRVEPAGTSIAVGPSPYLVREYASLSTRRLDVRLRARTTTVTEYELKLPAGAQVVSKAAPASATSPFGSYSVEAREADGVVRVKTTVTIDRSRVPVAEYAAFRAFCEAADRALGQRIVISKGKGS